MRIFSRKHIYLDYAGATPLDKNVTKAMRVSEDELFANPSAIHKGGVSVRSAIDKARANIARLINAHSDEIIFTGSGTESNALAVLGVVNNYKGEGIPHIITTNIEHHAVLENCKYLESIGRAEVTYIECDESGIVNPKDIQSALKENTILVSVMYANNEVGTIQPIQEIAKVLRLFRKSGKSKFSEHTNFPAEKLAQSFVPSRSRASENLLFPLFHVDSCQAMNYLMTENIEKLGVDLMSFNSSKIYGPKGVGILYKKRGITLAPLYMGGGQEFGLRSGTENTLSIIGASVALEIACKIKEKESARLTTIRDYGIEKILSLSDSDYKIILNGNKMNRLPNNINISIFGISSELLVIELDAKGIMVSKKSACSSKDENQSHVITAIHKKAGITPDSISGSIRISLGRQTTKRDIDILVESLKQILDKYKPFR